MTRLIGIGDNVVDKYVHIQKMYPGGNALNFSVYAKQVGAESGYMGVFGNDDAASHILTVLKTLDVDTSRCRIVDGENGCAMVSIVNGDRVFLGSNEGGVLKSNHIKLGEDDLRYIRTFDLVHTSCYSYIEDELPKLQDLGVPLSYDFSDDYDEESLSRICPYIQYGFLSCSHLDEKETEKVLRRVHGYGCGIAVATLGVRGAVLFNGDGFLKRKPAALNAVDTMGAGDAFIAGFLFTVAGGGSDSEDVQMEALKAGSILAAKACAVEGAFGYGISYAK